MSDTPDTTLALANAEAALVAAGHDVRAVQMCAVVQVGDELRIVAGSTDLEGGFDQAILAAGLRRRADQLDDERRRATTERRQGR